MNQPGRSSPDPTSASNCATLISIQLQDFNNMTDVFIPGGEDFWDRYSSLSY